MLTAIIQLQNFWGRQYFINSTVMGEHWLHTKLFILIFMQKIRTPHCVKTAVSSGIRLQTLFSYVAQSSVLAAISVKVSIKHCASGCCFHSSIEKHIHTVNLSSSSRTVIYVAKCCEISDNHYCEKQSLTVQQSTTERPKNVSPVSIISMWALGFSQKTQ